MEKQQEDKIQGYFWKMLFSVISLLVIVLPMLIYYRFHWENSERKDSSAYLINAKENADTALNFQTLNNQQIIAIKFKDTSDSLANAQITSNIVDRRIYVTFPEKMSEKIELLQADDSCLEAVYCAETENGTTLIFVLKDYYAASFQQSQEELEIHLESLWEMDEPLVVIELYNQMERTSVIAEIIAEQLKAEGIFVCVTGNEQRELTTQSRILFANELNASAYLQIGMASAEENGEAKTSVVCNPDYFIPNINSVTLADCVEYSTVEQLGGDPGGVLVCGEDNLIRNATIPACTILLGYRASESGVLSTTLPEYDDLAAQGIAVGILNALNGENGD